MKKSILIIVSIIIVIVLGVFAYLQITKKTKIEEPKPTPSSKTSLSSTDGITTVLTLEDEITDNTIWCGTFQLIWNDLKNDLAKQDIVFNPQLKVVENLNKETFTTKVLLDLINWAIQRAGIQDLIEITEDEEKITYKNKLFN